jgi:SAM-dependent methyltransferase
VAPGVAPPGVTARTVFRPGALPGLAGRSLTEPGEAAVFSVAFEVPRRLVLAPGRATRRAISASWPRGGGRGRRSLAAHAWLCYRRLVGSGDRMTTFEGDVGLRICPACGAEEAFSKAPVWPAGWVCSACGHTPPVVEGVPLHAPALADTLSGFDPTAFVALEGMEPGHFWFEPRNRLLARLCRRWFPAARRVLEIGCGTGFVLGALAQAFPAAELVGAELHPAGLAPARRRLGTRAAFAQMDARRITARRAFDLICAFDVVEHIEEDEAALASMHAALRPGGGVAIAVPQHPWLWSAADEAAHHVRRYRRGELEAKLETAGFRVLFSGSYCALPLPLMMASRLWERMTRRPGTPPRASEVEARPPALANAILRGMLEAEVSLTLAGLRFPLGGSRVVLARRADA